MISWFFFSRYLLLDFLLVICLRIASFDLLLLIFFLAVCFSRFASVGHTWFGRKFCLSLLKIFVLPVAFRVVLGVGFLQTMYSPSCTSHKWWVYVVCIQFVCTKYNDLQQFKATPCVRRKFWNLISSKMKHLFCSTLIYFSWDSGRNTGWDRGWNSVWYSVRFIQADIWPQIWPPSVIRVWLSDFQWLWISNLRYLKAFGIFNLSIYKHIECLNLNIR